MVSRFSILCNAAAAHFSGSSGQTAVQEVNGRDGVFLVFSRLRLFGLSARKALRGSHARGAPRAEGLSARARLPRVRSCNVRRARAGRGSHRPALGARAALQHHRNDGGIRRSSFLRRRARRALLGLQRDKNGRQRPYLSAVLARVGRARCARRAPRAARAGGSRRWHSVHRDEHRAALPRHRRAVEHRRAAALGRH